MKKGNKETTININKKCTFSSKESPKNPHYYADNDIFSSRPHRTSVFNIYMLASCSLFNITKGFF